MRGGADEGGKGNAAVTRYVLTGTPGAGKTSLLRELARRGQLVVPEAATDVIGWRQAAGEPEPWLDAGFTEETARVQGERQRAAVGGGPGAVWFHDRSPVCTAALAEYQGRPYGPLLAAELARIREEGVYRRQVFFVRNLGFCEPTGARRIGFAESLVFERLHEEVYRRHGFELIEVAAAPVAERADAVLAAVRRSG